MTKSANREGTVLVTEFKSTHALLLPGGRIPCPRMSRELDAQLPRLSNGQRPRQEPVHDRGLATGGAQSRNNKNHGQTRNVFNLRPASWQRIVRVHGPATGQNGQGQAIAMSSICPCSVRDAGLSASRNKPQPRTDSESCATRPPVLHRLCVATAAPTEFPVHIQHATAYELI